jgi:hypothetical protein
VTVGLRKSVVVEGVGSTGSTDFIETLRMRVVRGEKSAPAHVDSMQKHTYLLEPQTPSSLMKNERVSVSEHKGRFRNKLTEQERRRRSVGKRGRRR